MPDLPSGAPGIWVLQRHVVNQLTIIGSGTANSGGTTQVDLGSVPSGVYYEVERIVVDTVTGATFTLYGGAGAGASVTWIRERALVTADRYLVFDESSLIRLWPNETITAFVTGGTAGDQVTVIMQTQVVVWRSKFLPDELGPGVKITQGLEHGPDSSSPDPGGWN
jgi:hypothetical protein